MVFLGDNISDKTNHVDMSNCQNTYKSVSDRKPRLLFVDANDTEQGRGKTQTHIETDI